MEKKEILLSLWAEAGKITPELFPADGTLIKPDAVRAKLRELQTAMPAGEAKGLAEKVRQTGDDEFDGWFRDHFEPEYSRHSNCREVLCLYLKRWWCGQTLFHDYPSQTVARDLIFNENPAWDSAFNRLDNAIQQAGKGRAR